MLDGWPLQIRHVGDSSEVRGVAVVGRGRRRGDDAEQSGLACGSARYHLLDKGCGGGGSMTSCIACGLVCILVARGSVG